MKSAFALDFSVCSPIIEFCCSWFAGYVNHAQPRFDFTVNEEGADGGDGAKRITSIEIRRAGKPIQTIRYEGEEEAPIDFAPGDPVMLEDVDCDGNKDLLVRRLVGIHLDAWYFLYRFDPRQQKFIAYPPFTNLPYKGVNCHTRKVKTSAITGLAGCLYEVGWYRWVNHELLPARIETQDEGENGSLERTVRVWRNGKETVILKKSVSVDGCHSPNVPLAHGRN
jgi:hypothetical protein